MCKEIVIALIVSATIITLTGIVSKSKGNMYVVINVKPPRIVIKKKNSFMSFVPEVSITLLAVCQIQFARGVKFAMFKLSFDEQKELVYRIKQGDKKAAEELICAYEPLIVSIAAKYNRPDIFDDLKQEGAVAILQAAHKFDGSLGVSFVTFAIYYIKRNMDRCINRERVIRPPYNDAFAEVPQTVPMESVINGNSHTDEELKVKDIIKDNVDVEEQVMYNETLRRLVEMLTAKERKILLLRLKQYTYREIAQEMGLNERQVLTKMQKIRNKLQYLLKAS